MTVRYAFRIAFSWILIGGLVIAGAVSGSEPDITGFFDVTGTYRDSQDDKADFGLGQAEIDIDSDLSPTAAVAVAIAYNSQDGVFELGCAEIGINLCADENGFFSSVDVTAGQFDVPFGIDYNWYPSVDRKLVTPPLAVDLTHGGWNDMGLRVNVTSSDVNLVVFGVNGFESSFEVIDDARSLATGLAVGEEINTTPAGAFGGRVGLTPAPNFEVGGSFAVGVNEFGDSEMVLAGGDMQWSIRQLDLKGEYVFHSLNRSLVEETNQGYYGQATCNFARSFLVGRYGSFRPQGIDWYYRYSLGAGYAVSNGVELRFESAICENSDENTNILQLVAGF